MNGIRKYIVFATISMIVVWGLVITNGEDDFKILNQETDTFNSEKLKPKDDSQRKFSNNNDYELDRKQTDVKLEETSEILQCENTPNHSSPEKDLDLEYLSKVFENIDEKTSDFLLAYDLQNKEKHISFSLFEKLSESEDFRSVSDYNLLKLCSNEVLTNCNDQLVEELLGRMSINSASWLMAASYYAQTKNYDALVIALENSLSAPHYKLLFEEEMSIVSRAIKTTEEMSDKDVGMNLLGLHAAYSVPGMKYMDFCVDQANTSTELVQTCQNVAELMINKGGSDINVVMGFNLAIRLNEARGDLELAGKLRQRKTQHVFWNKEDYIKAFKLAMNDETLWGYLLESMLSYSEKEAKTRFVEEAKRRSRDPNYNPCRGKS